MGDVEAELPILEVELKSSDFESKIDARHKFPHRGPHLGVSNEKGIAQQDLQPVVILGNMETAPHDNLLLIHLEEEALFFPVHGESPQILLLEMIDDELKGADVLARCVVVLHGRVVG